MPPDHRPLLPLGPPPTTHLINHFHQKKPLGRGGGARLPAVAARQQPGEVFRGAFALADLHHGAHQGAHHTPEKTVGGD